MHPVCTFKNVSIVTCKNRPILTVTVFENSCQHCFKMRSVTSVNEYVAGAAVPTTSSKIWSRRQQSGCDVSNAAYSNDMNHWGRREESNHERKNDNTWGRRNTSAARRLALGSSDCNANALQVAQAWRLMAANERASEQQTTYLSLPEQTMTTSPTCAGDRDASDAQNPN